MFVIKFLDDDVVLTQDDRVVVRTHVPAKDGTVDDCYAAVNQVVEALAIALYTVVRASYRTHHWPLTDPLIRPRV